MRMPMVSFAAALLVTSLSFAGMNGSLVPFVQPLDGGLRADSEPAKQGTIVGFLVGGTGFGAVKGVHVDLEYDPTGMQFESFKAGDLFADPMIFGPFVRESRRVVDVTTATLAGAISRERGEVGLFWFRVLDPSRTDIRLVSFQTADESWTVETQISYENPRPAALVQAESGLLGNVPNPFNPTTEIRFALAARGPVRLEMFSVGGRRVRTLLAGVRNAGVHRIVWDGRDENGTPVSSGVYFCRFESDNHSESMRVTLLR